MSEQFQITPQTALTVVVTTVSIYLAFILMVRVLGPRSLTSMSSFDFACVVALGAVIGRTVLLTDPTLMIGIVALVTLFLMQGLLGIVRQNRRIDRLINRPPVLLVADGELLRENMRRVRVAEDEIRQAMRRAGVRGLADVQCVVLERNGAVSVIEAGRPIGDWLIADVAGRSGRRPR